MQWIIKVQYRIQFMKEIALGAQMKMWLFPIMLQFVPLHFRLDRSNKLGAIEGYNKLPCGATDKARWLKPVHRQAMSQTCGHVLVTFTSPEVAKKVLTNGLILSQK